MKDTTPTKTELRQQIERMRHALLLIQRGIDCGAIKCKPVVQFGKLKSKVRGMDEIVREALK